MIKKKDIMDNILVGHGEEFAARVEELNCLIYRNESGLKNEISEDPDGKFWQASKENVSVQVWEGKAKIKVRVSPGEKTISMKRIADIAVNAILEELKKED
ncbi:MAG: hypothetical protein K8S13_16800 [Desulfobacula sp.]|uniref:hypothetical protein n=1 Tax=Desulfobacula sp. TaxID=2593537 RepID=UPI0025B7A989|nr:hypothetical protein [Desulfobacula sp.]MCD4721499.1 hypothetical protein [Desulfobacula sp.]